VKATCTRTLDTLIAVADAAATMTCYRHPNRETRVSCPECGRGLCTDCMVYTPVGIKCAEHAGVARGAAKVAGSARRFSSEGHGRLLTKILIGANVGIFMLQLASGGGTLGYAGGGGLTERYDLYAPAVADGEWYRLLSAAFLHANLMHLGLNMLFLWWIGGPMEEAIGRGRYALIYVVSGLAGSAGALLFGHLGLFGTGPGTHTVGASGALFGILGAAFIFERQRLYVLGGAALSTILLNLAFGFVVTGISIGGHVGGLVGGMLCALALSRFGQAHAAYGRPGVLGIAGVIAVAVLSVAVAYWSVADLV
jgi:membrane associated rhomboid family serine protease